MLKRLQLRFGDRKETVLSCLFCVTISLTFLSCSGSSAPEPGGGQVLFTSNFESEDSTCWGQRPDSGGWNFNGCGGFVNIGQGDSVGLARNERARSGKNSLRVRFRRNEDYGGAELSIDETSHVFTRYYDYYGADFDFGAGVKLHRLRSFNGTQGINNFDILLISSAQASDGRHNFSGRNEMSSIRIGSNDANTNWSSGDYRFSFQRERWYCVETEIKLNDPGASNGIVRIWIDGNLVIDRSSLPIRAGLTNKINLLLFGGWYSNADGGRNPQPDPAKASVRYIDDIAVGTGRIGCELP